MITTINPATGEAIQDYSEMDDSEVTKIIQSTHQAFLNWKNTSLEKRAQKLTHIAEHLLNKKTDFAELINTEMGKPLPAATAEIEKCALACNFYAQHGEAFLKPRSIETEMKQSYISYHPTGILFGIMPWNFPFWQVFRFAAPNLMAGNAVLLKHAPNVTGCALAIEKTFLEAGFPRDLVRTLIITEEQTKAVIAHPFVQGITLTGSQRAGKAVAAEAGKHLKKVVLELGGSDPYIILEDADLEKAAEISVKSRLANSGQVCIAAKRFIVVNAIKNQFQKLLLEKLDLYHLAGQGDYALGPLAREDLREHLHAQVLQSIQQGAQLIRGGEIPNRPGFYYPITVLDDVKKGMTAYEEELFGPVVSIIHAKDEEHAIKIANDTNFGLAAAVFTQDLERGQQIADQQIIAGTCYVNKQVSSDPRLPFGGVKSSGFGRELGEVGIHEFVNIKTIGVGVI